MGGGKYWDLTFPFKVTLPMTCGPPTRLHLLPPPLDITTLANKHLTHGPFGNARPNHSRWNAMKMTYYSLAIKKLVNPRTSKCLPKSFLDLNS
jgi:hypothetical protein